MPEALTNDQDRDAINIIRGLAMDAPLYSKSGHQGTAMALAPVAHVLYSRVMHHDPTEPLWRNRDRFILSNGHASILQYSLLMLNGYGLEIDDIKQFRQWGSQTPGHPEAGHTTGIEVTTGPLGQGFANSVGMALAERNLRARFGAEMIDHHTFVIAGDGCLMEGVSHEAASLAGHLGLGRLVCIYDDNHVTIDGETELALSDDAGRRFEAYGWHVEHLGEIADDLDSLEAGIRRAMAVDDRPSLLILRSHIGFPSPDHTDDYEAHGNPFTVEDATRTKAAMGIPDEPYWAPADIVAGLRRFAAERGKSARSASDGRAAGSTGDHAEWEACWGDGTLPGWSELLPKFTDDGKGLATRQALAKTLSVGLSLFPGLIAGSADLTGNTGVKLDGASVQSKSNPAGRQVHYGVREHAMGGAMVGMALHGGVLPAGGTFFVFSDYMKPAIRLAALSRARVLFVFSHDSVGVGEDGPTHQPVEQLAALRAIPGLQVIRPADANETVAALRTIVAHHGPTALILSRQAIPVCTDGSAVDPGAAIIGSTPDPDVVLVGTGSEVHVCIAAAATLAKAGATARVVSMPSWDRFAIRTQAERLAVLPAGVPVVSVEAASTFGWAAWADACIGIDRFGASAPGGTVLTNLGINPDHVVAVATSLLSR